MASRGSGVEDLGGIGIRVIADASQIRKGFEQELKGFTANPIEIPIKIDDKGKIRELRKQLAGLDVPITVKINRETARSLKRDIQQRLEGEGGVFIPIKVKNLTSAEAQAIREQILAAVGPLEFDVKVRIQTEGGGGGGGGPAGFFFRRGPSGGGGGGGTGASQRVAGAATAPPQPEPEPVVEEAAQVAAEAATGRQKRKRKGPGRFTRIAGESEEQHRARLLEMKAAEEAILEERGTDVRRGRTAYNRLISIRKHLGEEGPTARLPALREGQQPFPERVDAAGRTVRGPASVGPLLSDVRQGARTPTGRADEPGGGKVRTDAELFREIFGVDFDEFGRANPGGTGLSPRAIERRAERREVQAVREAHGFRGQRATRSPFGEGLELTPEQMEQRRLQNIERIQKTQQIPGFENLIAGLAAPTDNWAKFVEGLKRNEKGRFVGKAGRQEKLADVLGKPFMEALEALEGGDPVTALRAATGRRSELLGAAFENKGRIPGVGKSTAKRYLDPKREDLPPHATEEQIKFIEELQALDAVRGEIFARWDRERAIMRRAQGGEDAARTRAGETTGVAIPKGKALPSEEERQRLASEPFKAVVPEPPRRPLMVGFQGRGHETETREEFRARKKEVEEAHAEAMEKYNRRVERARQSEAENAERIKRFAERRTQETSKEEPEPITATQAAEQLDLGGRPPGAVGGGGGGDEGVFVPFFGGGEGGGPIPVTVENWPAWMTGEGSRAASGFVGMESIAHGSQGPGRGPTTLSDEEIAAGAREHDAKEAKKASRRRTKTSSDKTKQQRRVRSVTRPSALARQLQERSGGALTDEDVEGILDPFGVKEPSGLDIARQAIEQQLAEARQGLPIRGFATSVAQLVAGPSRGAATARFQRAGQKLAQASTIERGSNELRSNLELQQRTLDALNREQEKGVKLTKQQKDLLQSLPKDIEKGTESLKERDEVQQELVDQASELAKLTPGEKIANLGKSLVGSLGGFIGYTAALGAAGAGLAAIGAAAGDALERLTGFHSFTREFTDSLSEQTRAQGGAVKQTVANAAAQSNLAEETYNAIKASLEQRAAVESGNKAMQDQNRIIAASRNVGAEQRGGLDRGLFETTGGLNLFGLQTPIFGTPSTQELIGQELNRINREHQGGSFLDPTGIFARTVGPDAGELANDFSDDLKTLQERFRGTGLEFVKATDEMAASQVDAAKAFRDADFGNIADAILAGRISVSQASLAGGRAGIQQSVALANERAQRPDPRVLLQALEERALPALQFSINQNLQNALSTFIPANRAIRNLAQPVAPFGRGLVPLGEDQRFGIGDRGAVTGLNVGGETRFSGVPQEAIDSFKRYEDRAKEAIDDINAKAAEGERVLAQRLGVPESTIAQLRGFGEEISAINQRQADIRLDLQMTQYNRQLFLAKRQLGDLAGLTERAGATQIGLLQRQDLLLSRRAQALSLETQQLSLQTQQLQLQGGELSQQQSILQLELAQRRVNFQRAAAGFTAPGTTPEERAARIEEAKVEADYAQREIDFQRQQLGIQQQVLKINREQFGLQQQATELAQQQFRNQVALQDALNNRAYEDQLAAIAEIQKAFEAAQELQGLENLKGLIERQRDELLEEVEAQANAGKQLMDAMTQFATDLISQTGEATTEIVNDVATVFERVRNLPSPFPNWARGDAGGDSGEPTRRSGGGGGGGRTEFRAEGRVSSYSSPTRITVGEAGTEEVAILRNPRQVFANVGGGGAPQVFMPITITGNNIAANDDAALAAMADKLARLVEERLGRRGRALGFGAVR